MSFFAHMRRCGWELGFSALASSCTAACLSEGFWIPQELAGRLLPALLLCLVLNAAAYAFSYSKKSAAAGFGVLALALVCSGLALSRGAGEGAVYAAVVGVSCLALFFLSRSWIGALLALPLGALVITGEMLFEYGSHPELLALFLLSSGCLALTRLYRAEMLRSSTRRAAFSTHAVLSILACVLAVLLASAAYFGVVRPLAPPSYEVMLKTELRRLPILEKLGVATTISLPDPGDRTDDVYDSDLLADLDHSGSASPQPSEPPEEERDPDDRTELPPSSSPADAIRRFAPNRSWLCAAAAAVVLGALAAVLGRLAARRRRLFRILSMSPREQVTELYPMILNAMEQCGLPPMNANTPTEFCKSFGTRIGNILGGQPDFSALTGVFERAFYGGLTPGEDERREYIALCRRLPSLCRKNVGLLRYVLVFFKV